MPSYLETAEEWRIIPSFPDYEASSFGRIRRRTPAPHTRPGRILKTPPNRCGYLKASLSIDNKMKHTTVHSLVAEAFFGIRPLGKVVNHKDLNKTNCRPENLEYVTREENEAHAQINGHKADAWRDALGILSPTRKLSIEQVLEIKLMRKSGRAYREISEKFGVSVGQIRRICIGERWGWMV